MRKIEAVVGGFALGESRYIINADGGEKVYKVALGTGTYQLAVFYVDSDNEQQAIDRTIDFCEDNDYKGYYTEYVELVEDAGDTEDVENYIDGCGLKVGGNAGHYVDLQGIEEDTEGL